MNNKKINNIKLRKDIKNKQKGVTLIALVVTIIVLIILAGITISTLLGDNGIIEKTRVAKDSQRGAAVYDEVELAVGENEMHDYLEEEGNRPNSKASVAYDLWHNKGYLIEEEYNKLTGNGVPEQDKIKIGTVTIDFSRLNGDGGGSGGGTGNISIELSIAGTKVNATTPPNPDPSIFEHTEGTIDTGYVIKDKNNGNEFVWVPVEANQKITLKVTSTEEITGITLYDPYGDEINLGLSGSIGKTYNNTNITPTANGGYTAKVTTASESKTKTLGVRSLYALDTYSDYRGSDVGMQEEADLWYSGSIDDMLEDYGYTDIEEYKIKNSDWMKDYSDTVDYKTSVNTNGGFYIARYEAGAPTARTSGSSSATTASIIASNGTPVCTQDQTPYNYITQAQAKGLAESMYTSSTFTCTLPTGASWDRTLGWLEETGDKSLSKIVYDSTSFGNYYNATFNITRGKYSTNNGSSYTSVSSSYTKPENNSVLLTTGAAPSRNVSNSIYDLAGNVWEWTTEVYGSNLVVRGGVFNNHGDDSRVSSRGGCNATDYNGNVGFRPALYL